MAYISSNRRLLKNTLFLFSRQLLSVFIGFYTTRIVLQQLGIDDFGIYNVVYGFVAMFDILTGAISVAISRFVTYELGNGNYEKIQKLFSMSILVQLLFGGMACIISAAVGYWFLKYHAVIPADRMEAAIYVLFFACISFFFRLLNVPFDAMIIAHEHMSLYALKGIIESVAKLAIALGLIFTFYDKLEVYAAANTVVVFFILLICVVYVKKAFKLYRLKLYFDVGTFKNIMSFTGWAFLGNGSYILREQMLNIMLNLFFGNAVNAARGVSVQVSGAMTNFVNTFLTSAQPQITKLYASNNLAQMERSIFMTSKLAFYLMSVFAFPIIFNIDYILNLWLTTVPPYTLPFVLLFIISALIDTLSWPFVIGIFAEGHIKTYENILLVLNLSSLPISYLLLKNGMPPESIYVVTTVMCVFTGVCRIFISKKSYGIDVKKYITSVLPRVFSVSLISILPALFLMRVLRFENGFVAFALNFAADVALVVSSIAAVGLTSSERRLIIDKIKETILRRLSSRRA